MNEKQKNLSRRLMAHPKFLDQDSTGLAYGLTREAMQAQHDDEWLLDLTSNIVGGYLCGILKSESEFGMLFERVSYPSAIPLGEQCASVLLQGWDA